MAADNDRRTETEVLSLDEARALLMHAEVDWTDEVPDQANLRMLFVSEDGVVAEWSAADQTLRLLGRDFPARPCGSVVED